MGYQDIVNCLACGGSNLVRKLDLGRQPLANTYPESPSELPLYELALNYCLDCTHVQLTIAVDPDELYRDYKYVSGTTQTLKEHFRRLVLDVDSELDDRLNDAPSVLDIGCNDGSLLEEFKQAGYRIHGVDPAENLKELAESRGAKIFNNYFDLEFANTLQGKYDVVTALNCLAHNSYPLGFLLGIQNILANEGIAVLEFPLFSISSKTADLGQIYAEHHSYFTERSISALVGRTDLAIHRYTYLPNIHGGTLRLFLRRKKEVFLVNSQFGENSINAFLNDINRNIAQLKQVLLGYQLNNVPVVAYGASAKSATLFNIPEMQGIQIKYMVDDNPLKQGRFCPGSNFPIYAPEKLKEEGEVAILLTVHNFKPEVLERLRSLGLSRQLLINYTPSVSVELI